MTRTRGKVKWFDEEKGYGYIKTNHAVNDVFVHFSELPKGYSTLEKGQEVDFILYQCGDKKIGGIAKEIGIISEKSPPTPKEPIPYCSCKYSLDLSWRFCSHCGKHNPHPPDYSCESCKTPIPTMSRFCPNCGKMLKEFRTNHDD